MKILVIVPYFDEPHRWMISGQKTAYKLAEQHQVLVLTTGRETTQVKINSNLTIYRLKDIFLPDPINYSIVPGLFQTVKQIVYQEKPDACLINKHMFYTSLAIYPLRQLGLKPVIQIDTFPGINWFPRRWPVRVAMWLYARLIGNPILRRAERVVLLHEGLVPVAKKLHLNYQVIHNGIDLDNFDASPPPSDLKKGKNEIWIGYVGRLESIKGWYDLATVAKELVEVDRRLRFFFVGPTENATERIKEFKHPNIKFVGLRKDVAGINKLLDIFVMPSYSEGLSNALMEAMAAGCICLVSNVGGNKILIQEGNTGLTFPPGDQAQLKDQLIKILNNPARLNLMSRAARKVIEQKFSLTDSIKQLSIALQDTLQTTKE